MLSIIKTAIITIIISFISGILLDYYKNLAPRILCSIKNMIPMKKDGKKIFAYMITIRSLSKKTVHNITVNIQSPKTELKMTDAKITRGLKFESSQNNSFLDVHIPFLSKGDTFSATVYTEDENSMHSKPIVAIRSPENFKQIDSSGKYGLSSSFQGMLKGSSRKNNVFKIDRTSLISMLLIFIVIFAGTLGVHYLKKTPAKSTGTSTNTSTYKGSDTPVKSKNNTNQNSHSTGSLKTQVPRSSSNSNNKSSSSSENKSDNSSGTGSSENSTDNQSSTSSKDNTENSSSNSDDSKQNSNKNQTPSSDGSSGNSDSNSQNSNTDSTSPSNQNTKSGN